MNNLKCKLNGECSYKKPQGTCEHMIACTMQYRQRNTRLVRHIRLVDADEKIQVIDRRHTRIARNPRYRTKDEC